MQKIVCAIFFTVLTSTYSLKLLVNDDYVEDDDEAWESDIEFSYKPYKGKCVKTDGTITATHKNGAPYEWPACGGFNDDAGAYKGCLSKYQCNPGFTAAEQNKYCTFPAIPKAGSGTTFAATKDSKFWEITKGLVQTASDPLDPKLKWKLSKFVHYVAKLASMSNLLITATNSGSNYQQQKVESFDLKKDMTAVVFYKNIADDGEAGTANTHLCYSKIGMAWAKNDPKVKNINGEEFEIMASGTFSLLSLKTSQKTVLEAAATIDRAGTRCGATYIQNLTLSGQWVEDIGVASIQVKAEAAVPKAKALQVNLAGEWQPATSVVSWALETSPFVYAAVYGADAKKIVFKLNNVKVLATVDSHRIYEAGVKTRRFANFLNVNFEGISRLSGLSVGGLLGRDSHDEAAQLPDGCESQKLLSEEEKVMLSSVKLA